MENLKESHLLYYQRELSFLRKMGTLFSLKYPKIARRLNFSKENPSDPHTERLLESFAFLTSFLQKDIDTQFPRFSSALFKILYPYLMTPVPSMSIAQFEPNDKEASNHHIPRNFNLSAQASTGEVCRFKTAYPVDVWPIEIEDINLVKTEKYGFGAELTPHTYLLRIKLKSLGPSLENLNIKRLRFFINAGRIEANLFYELLFRETPTLAILNDNTDGPVFLESNSLRQVGFSLDESLIPCPPNAHPAYGLLQEYFLFSKKFMFFDIENLNFKGAKTSVDIFIPLIDTPKLHSLSYTQSLLQLGCTPIINLFQRTTEPLRLDHKKIEYRLVPDYRREISTEIYKVEKVFTSELGAVEVQEIEPYFSYDYHPLVQNKTNYWFERRVTSENPNIPGTDILMSFVDLNFKPTLPASQVVYARTLCTNRQLASQLSTHTLLQSDEEIPIKKIICLYQPTSQIYPPEDGATQWQLISNLSLNYLSLSSNEEKLKALKELLTLYAGTNQQVNEVEINNLISVRTYPTTHRIGTEAWRGLVDGTAIELTLAEEEASGLGGFVFSAVLSHFFGFYTRINSFTALTLRSHHKEEIWKTWPPMAGAKTVV